MFDNFTRAALLNAPPGMVLATLATTPIQADTPTDDQPAIVRASPQSVSIQATASPPKRWRIPRFGLGLGTST